MGAHKVRIAARLRPCLPREVDDGLVRVELAQRDGDDGSHAKGNYIAVTNPRDPSQIFKFPFSSCYGQDSTQEEIFSNDVAPLLEHVFHGITVTIFAYGVTSSGKTHTMQGTSEDPGVIPRVVEAVFGKQASIRDYDVSIYLSYFEIYKDEVYDLLVSRTNAQKLPVRENDAGEIFVANLTTLLVSSVSEFEVLYTQAIKQRSVSSTLLNNASSRSHAVLSLTVTLSSPSKVMAGKINLIDLAGSENNKLTGNNASRMAESAAINKSLSVLGQVVHALNSGATRIPYRNSKLTRILQAALGGSSLGLLICNIAPGVKFRQDTLNTLNFAVRTKNVENKPVVNERDTRPQAAPRLSIHPTRKPLKPADIPGSKNASRSRHVVPANGMRSPRPSCDARRPSIARSSLPRRSSINRPSSILPKPRPSKVAWSSIIAERPAQPRHLALGALTQAEDKTKGGWAGLTDKEIDERISRVVEIEVARRLKEEAEKKLSQDQQHSANAASPSRDQSPSAPSRRTSTEHSMSRDMLSPILRQHRDLDNELRARLADVEKTLDRRKKEADLADVLSPVSRKRTGRAYVALARAHSEKGDLEIALDLYRKAASYVPDNQKLRERIIQIELALETSRPFVPSPRKKGQRNSKVKGMGKRKVQTNEKGNKSKDEDRDENWLDYDEDEEGKMQPIDSTSRRGCQLGHPELFGLEMANSDLRSPFSKRRFGESEDPSALATSAKRSRPNL